MIFRNTPNSNGEIRQFRIDASRAMALLRQCPAYAPSPLLQQQGLAEEIGIAALFIKDESKRMRLGSFKALGGAFAVAQLISDAAGTTDFESQQAKTTAANMTFITASAGNHGLSVAAGARIFGARAIIFLSSSVPEGFANRIRAMDAQIVRVDGSYEDSVGAAIAAARDNDWLLLADGSWDGYTERPALVMEGYTVLAEECRTQFSAKSIWPSHVFLQAGVGGLAAAVAGHIRQYWDRQPTIIIIEPEAAACLMESIQARQITRGEGPLSNMGRLDCKDASLIAFGSLKNDADFFVTISDDEAALAVSVLARYSIDTTPSGAASFAALPRTNLHSANLNLDEESRCLVFVTEGPEEG
jgi:diaminopropionate ammonia-lyase